MAISKQQKEEILAGLVEQFKASKSVVFAENKGLNMPDLNELRASLREKNAGFTVAKKTLFKKALEANDMKVDEEVWNGAIGAVFAFEDEFSNIKIAYEFAKKNDEKFVIHGGIFEGKGVDAKHIASLATIPSREELLAKLMGSINAPLSNFVGVGNSLISSFVRACSEVAKQKENA